MKVKATAVGFFHKPIMVLRGGKEVSTCLVDVGDVFEIEKPGSWMEPIGPVQNTPTEKQDIMARLDELGIKYFKGATVEALAKLLPKE